MSDIQKDKKTLSIKDSDKKFTALFKDFLKNEYHGFALQKAEKLASALYMVTGFIPGDDPLRTRLRVCAVDLVTTTAAKAHEPQDIRAHENFTARCLEIGTILKLAERAGFVSSMNANILSDEYAELAAFVRTHHEQVFGSMTLTGTQDVLDTKGAISKGHFKKTPVRRAPTNPKRQQTPRREAILKLLDKKGKVSIKDISASIKDCSEKTIQRELMLLVEEGVLLKEGERRWSTYRKAVTV